MLIFNHLDIQQSINDLRKNHGNPSSDQQKIQKFDANRNDFYPEKSLPGAGSLGRAIP